MSKEEILNKSYKSLIKYLDWNIECEKEIKEVISQALDQTREETIMEIEGVLPEPERMINFNFFTEKERANKILGFEECLREIKQSLINLRK